jgi:hypothetical protein
MASDVVLVPPVKRSWERERERERERDKKAEIKKDA